MQSDESVSFTKVVVRSAGDVMTSSPSQSRIYNPFDHDTPNRLQHSVFSPNMFTCVSSPSDECRPGTRAAYTGGDRQVLVVNKRDRSAHVACRSRWRRERDTACVESIARRSRYVIVLVLCSFISVAASIASLSTLPTHGSPSANRYSPMIASSSDGPSVPLRKS
ncbi:unnamed protein product [Sphagnum balticum]